MLNVQLLILYITLLLLFHLEKMINPLLSHVKKAFQPGKLKFTFKAFVSFWVLVFFLYESYSIYVEFQFFNLHLRQFIKNNIDLNRCEIPDFDPFNKNILKYIAKPKPITCAQTDLRMTYIDDNGFLTVNETSVRQAGYEMDDIYCFYQEIIRENMTDSVINYADPKIFTVTKISCDFVSVTCMSKSGTVLYQSGHAHVPLRSSTALQRSEGVQKRLPSVLIIVIDSMSRQNFVRQLPNTYNFLVKTLNASVLRGLTIVGDNTYSNMFTFLTGMRPYRNKFPQPTWEDFGSNEGPYDDIPAAWKNFSQKGYVTMFCQEDTISDMFNYASDGFQKQPTDYYMRPFWLAMDQLKLSRYLDMLCVAGKPKHVFLFDYVREFATKMKNRSYFALCLLVRPSHDDLNAVNAVDDDIVERLRDLHRSKSLDNTITIVTSDHGYRFGDFIRTTFGRIEHRMPFFSIVFPLWMRTAYPHLVVALEKNKKVLLSWHDMHELLLDIAMLNLGPESKVKRWGWIGNSPLRPIPVNRSCSDIGIPDEYCICTQETPIPVNNTITTSAAEDLVTHINSILEKVRIVCAKLTLDTPVNADLLFSAFERDIALGLTLKVRITVKVNPGGGLFEGVLQRNAWSSNYDVVGDVNRINVYGNQSYCVNDRILKPLCYCTDLLQDKSQSENSK